MLRDFAGTANSRWRNTLGSTKGLAGERSYWECFCPGVKRLNKSEGGRRPAPLGGFNRRLAAAEHGHHGAGSGLSG